MLKELNLRKIGEAFRLPGTLSTFDTITNGNINTTYRVTYRTDAGGAKAYIFQRINTVVFSNPVQIMHNIDLVTSHIREKYPNERTLHFHHTADGKLSPRALAPRKPALDAVGDLEEVERHEGAEDAEDGVEGEL